MVLTLYKLDASPPVRSVLMVIKALGLKDVEGIDVNLFDAEHMKEDYIKMNPQHTIPLLKDDDICIWDSHAIVVYLVTKYGSDDSLYPADAEKRAIIDQRLHFDSGILFPALKETVEPILFRGEKLNPERLDNIKQAYEFSEMFLTKAWLAGDELTLADICCGSTLSSLNEILPIDETLYPKLSGWLERCSQEEIFKEANEPGLAEFRGRLKQKLG